MPGGRQARTAFNDRRKTLGLNLEQSRRSWPRSSAQVAQAQAIVLAEYRSLEVGDMTELRTQGARLGRVPARSQEHPGAPRRRDTPFAGLAEQMVGPLVYGISADPVAAAKVLQRVRQGQREVRDQGRRDAERGHVRQGSRGARDDAEPRGAAREAHGHDAGADRQVRRAR